MRFNIVIMGGGLVLKSEKRESQKFKKRYGPRRHKMLGINKWTRKKKEIREEKENSNNSK